MTAGRRRSSDARASRATGASLSAIEALRQRQVYGHISVEIRRNLNWWRRGKEPCHISAQRALSSGRYNPQRTDGPAWYQPPASSKWADPPRRRTIPTIPDQPAKPLGAVVSYPPCDFHNLPISLGAATSSRKPGCAEYLGAIFFGLGEGLRTRREKFPSRGELRSTR
jgi:hypothetical protein